MTAGVVGVLAEALAQHAQAVGNGGVRLCFCGGWRSDPADMQQNSLLSHAEHVASVVAALPNIAIVPTIRGDWAPGRWWRVIAPNNIVWCETSDEHEARAAIRDGDVLERLHDGPQLREWRAVAGGQA